MPGRPGRLVEKKGSLLATVVTVGLVFDIRTGAFFLFYTIQNKVFIKLYLSVSSTTASLLRWSTRWHTPGERTRP